MIPFAIGLDAAIALFKRWRWLILAAPLALALGVQTWRLSTCKQSLQVARATIAQMTLASEAARAAQIALHQRNQELSQRIADDAHNSHVQNRAAVSRALADYAARHRLRAVCQGRPSQANLAPLRGDPGTPDRTDGNEVLAIPREDFESLARDALRGAEARSFLIDLANEGLAVVSYPEPAFGK